MKFTLTSLFVFSSLLLFSGMLAAQNTDVNNYPETEFVVVYENATALQEREELRNLYGVTSFQSLFGGLIEVWEGLVFPVTVIHNDGTVTLFNVDDLEFDINTSGLGDSDPRARVSSGDFNYDVQLNDDNSPLALYEEHSAPLQFCPDSDGRIFGNLRSTVRDVHVIIFDQVLDHTGLTGRIEEVIQVTDNPGGTHANKVTWIIDDVLSRQGIEDITYTNIGVFDAQGAASYADLLVGFHELEQSGITDAILNFSANLTFAAQDISRGNALLDVTSRILENQNLLMVSSAGNDGSNGNSIFPGCFDFPNEITVVGTTNCFTSLWSSSNTNSFHYEIAAEAVGIVVNDGSEDFLVSGTSFAAPLVSAVIAQLSMSSNTFSPEILKSRLLNGADSEPALAGYVYNQKVLNITGVLGGSQDLQGSQLESTTYGQEREQSDLVNKGLAYPNPFSNSINIQLPVAHSSALITTHVYRMDGQLVLEAAIHNGSLLALDHLPPGVYILQLQQGAQQWRQKMVKQ